MRDVHFDYSTKNRKNMLHWSASRSRWCVECASVWCVCMCVQKGLNARPALSALNGAELYWRIICIAVFYLMLLLLLLAFWFNCGAYKWSVKAEVCWNLKKMQYYIFLIRFFLLILYFDGFYSYYLWIMQETAIKIAKQFSTNFKNIFQIKCGWQKFFIKNV